MNILFPDSELWLTGALRAALAAQGRPAYVDVRVPTTRRPIEVIVRRDGGPDGLVTSTQRFGIRVFADTEQNATNVADLTAALLRSLRFTGPARHITTTSPVPVPDVSKKPLRYFTAEVAVRGNPLTINP